MSNSVHLSFVRQYEKDLIHVFQRMGGYLRKAVRVKSNVVGMSTTFQRVGRGIATTKARHGVITPMNQDHTPIELTLQDFYAGDWVDRLDEAKLNIDERMAIAQAGAFALGRKVDRLIITELGLTLSAMITIGVTSSAAVRAGLIQMAEAAWAADVPNDGNVFAIITPRLWSQAMTVAEFNSADFVTSGGMSYKTGPAVGLDKWKDWNGVKWAMHTGLNGIGSVAAEHYLWHKSAVGFATGRHAGNVAENETVNADITWHGDRAAHFVNHLMSGGARLIEGSGVIRATSNDTIGIVTT